MQRHMRVTTREITLAERQSLEKVRAGVLPSWTMRLNLEELGLVSNTRRSSTLTPAGVTALQRGKVRVTY